MISSAVCIPPHQHATTDATPHKGVLRRYAMWCTPTDVRYSVPSMHAQCSVPAAVQRWMVHMDRGWDICYLHPWVHLSTHALVQCTSATPQHHDVCKDPLCPSSRCVVLSTTYHLCMHMCSVLAQLLCTPNTASVADPSTRTCAVVDGTIHDVRVYATTAHVQCSTNTPT